MSYRIHFSSGESGVVPGAGMSLEEQAQRHARDLHGGLAGRSGEFAYALEVRWIRDVVEHLEGIRRAGGSVAFMDFHAHGRPGEIAVGEETIFDWSRHFGGRGFESLFARDARIEFHGCNVAAEGDGEAFLAECAWTFLRVNGGTVSGSAWWEFAYPDSAVPLSPGARVVAEIGAGGHVQLRNNQHLIPGALRTRREALWRRYSRLRSEPRSGARDRLDSIEQFLRNAALLLAGHPSYAELNRALAKLDSAERSLDRIDPAGAVPITFGW